MTTSKSSKLLSKLSQKYGLDIDLLEKYSNIFDSYDIPILKKPRPTRKVDRIVMVSTHGYWGDPPPAGVPDTGGQTYYVLEVSKAWAKKGKKVIILARWFEPYPLVEQLDKNLWLVRINAGSDEFVRKEEIYSLVPQMSENATAISALFGAQAVMGHYADGMAGSVEIAERLGIPVVTIPHSIGVRKIITNDLDPYDPEVWFDDQYNFWTRESYELASLQGTNLEVANTPAEPAVLKDYYGLEFPYIILPAGAGQTYFDAYKNADSSLLSEFGLTPNKYTIFFGRLSEAKNIPGSVAVFAEARKLNPKFFADIKHVIVGGDPNNPQEEELVVEKQIKEVMQKYDLTENEIVRLPSQNWDKLSILAKHSLFYIGMQHMEPFGMAAAEAMATGTPIVISKNAGITRWLTDNENALVVDPDNHQETATRIVELIGDRKKRNKISKSGHKFAKSAFSWSGIAKILSKNLDNLHKKKILDVDNNSTEIDMQISKREGRAYHRLAFIWRGDPPIVREKHKKAAEGLLPHILKKVEEEKKNNRRVVLSLGGESGAGKSEVAEYLRFLLRQNKTWAVTFAGDAFFKKVPAENHKARIEAYENGKLEDYLGPQEVDLERLESIIDTAKDLNCEEVSLPSDCRHLGARRYDEVPVSLQNVEVILVDLTYSLLLRNAQLKAFFESDYKKRIEEVKERNLSRDPDQDFDFILKVLDIEHGIIQNLKKGANLIIVMYYSVEAK